MKKVKDEKISFITKQEYSSGEMLETSFRWKIPNYNVKKLYSEKIVISNEIECVFMLLPKQENTSYHHRFFRVYTRVFFTKIPSDEKCPTYFQYVLRSMPGSRIISFGTLEKATLNENGFTAERNNISLNTYKRFLYDDGLNMGLTLCLINPEYFKSLNVISFEKESSCLAKNFATAFNNPKLSDITIICDNNEQIPAHKAILAARSPVFAQILNDQVTTYNMDVCKEAAMEFLRFLYCETIDSTQFGLFTIDIMHLADKFEIKELKNLAQNSVFGESKKKLEIAYQKFSEFKIEDVLKIKNLAEIGRDIINFYDHINQI